MEDFEEELEDFFEEEKTYDIEVTIKTIHTNVLAYSRENAIDEIKEFYHDEYGIELRDDEIEIIDEEVV